MRIVGHDVFGIGRNGTINKLIIISTGLYKSEMEIDIQKLCGVQSGNGFSLSFTSAKSREYKIQEAPGASRIRAWRCREKSKRYFVSLFLPSLI